MRENVYKFIALTVLIIVLLLICPKQVLVIRDLFTVAVTLLGTISLMVLNNATISDVVRLKQKFRLSIFIMGFLTTWINLYGLFLEMSKLQDYNNFIYETMLAFKPLFFSMIFYQIGLNVIAGIKQSIEKRDVDNKTVPKCDLRSVQLTRREMEIAELIFQGKNNRVIGEELFIAESTVKKHVQNILKKTACNNREMLMENYNLPIYE